MVVFLPNCSVVAWEPVPQFRALLSFNLAANKLAHLVTVREGVVADNPQGTQVCGLYMCVIGTEQLGTPVAMKQVHA